MSMAKRRSDRPKRRTPARERAPGKPPGDFLDTRKRRELESLIGSEHLRFIEARILSGVLSGAKED
jgi:hypothetical protein